MRKSAIGTTEIIIIIIMLAIVALLVVFIGGILDKGAGIIGAVNETGMTGGDFL